MKILKKMLVLVLCCCFLLSGCSDEAVEKTDTIEGIDSQTETQTQTKEELPTTKYNTLYANGGVAVLVKDDDSTERLTKIYGSAVISKDGSVAAYRQETTLYVKRPNEGEIKIADNAEGFYLEPQGRGVFAMCEDGLYYSADLKTEAIKIGPAVEMTGGSYKVAVTPDMKYVFYADKEHNLRKISLNNFSDNKVIDTSAAMIGGVLSENVFTYSKIDGDDYYLYKWVNGKSEKIGKVSDSIGTEEFSNSIWVAGYALSSDGSIIEATNYAMPYEIAAAREKLSDESLWYLAKFSDNEKYLASFGEEVKTSKWNLYRYEIKDNTAVNKTHIGTSKSGLTEVFDDGTVCYSDDEDWYIFTEGKSNLLCRYASYRDSSGRRKKV